MVKKLIAAIVEILKIRNKLIIGEQTLSSLNIIKNFWYLIDINKISEETYNTDTSNNKKQRHLDFT